jgi:hypothetical protein
MFSWEINCSRKNGAEFYCASGKRLAPLRVVAKETGTDNEDWFVNGRIVFGI